MRINPKLFTMSRHYDPKIDGDANLILVALNQKTNEVISVEMDMLAQLVLMNLIRKQLA